MFVVILAVVALAGALSTLIALIALHALPTGLSPIRDAVSAYGISRHHRLYRVQTLGTAIAAAALAGAVALDLPDAIPAVLSLAALAIARAVISWFPMDADPAARTRTGRIHNLLAFAAFAAASVSGFMIAIAFSSDPALSGLADAAGALGWFTTAASALTILAAVARPLAPVFGLAERLIYVGMLGILGLGATALLVA